MLGKDLEFWRSFRDLVLIVTDIIEIQKEKPYILKIELEFRRLPLKYAKFEF